MYNRDLETSADVKAEYNRQQKESAAKRLSVVAEKKRLKRIRTGK
jgi:hypothetical protein